MKKNIKNKNVCIKEYKYKKNINESGEVKKDKDQRDKEHKNSWGQK